MWTKVMRLQTLLLVMTMLITTATADSSYSSLYIEQETALLKELFRNYHVDALPANTTTLEMGNFRLIHFDMHEREHFLEVHGWYNWQWTDPRLSWNETKYDKISVLRVPASKVWRPDIVIYSSVDWLNLNHHGDVKILIYPDGSILYVPPAVLKSSCVADLTYWPHDVHDCIIKIGSWTYDGIVLNVTAKEDKFDMTNLQKSDTSDLSRSEWELVNHNVSRNVKMYDCCDEPYIDIKYHMTLKRNAPALAYTFKIPAVGLSFLSLFVFLLPPAAGEKLLLSSLLLLMDMQFLIHTTDVVQNAPTHTPIVVRLVSEQLYLVLISLIISVVSLRMARPPHGEQLPTCIMAPLRAMAPLLLLGKYSNLSKNFHPVQEKDEVELGDSTSLTLPLDSKNKKEPGDWILIAAIVDRILFIIYFFIVMANLIAYTSVL